MMAGILMGTALAVYIGERGTPFAVSMVLTAYFLGLLLFSPVWGAVADVTGRRRAVLVATGILATLAALGLLVVDGVWAPIGFRLLYAVFAAGFAPVMLAIVSEHGGAEGRGKEIGYFNTARATGFTGAQLAAGALLGLLLPSGIYLVIAAMSLISTVAVALLADPTPTPERPPTAPELLREMKTRLLPAVDEREHLREKGLRWLYIAIALRNMSVLGVQSLLPPFLIVQVGVTPFVMGAILALNPGGQMVCMYLFGKVADVVGRKPLIIAGMAGSAFFGLVMAFSTTPGPVPVRGVVAGIATLFQGVGFAAMATGALAFIGDVAPVDRESELMGLQQTAKGLGGVLGPVLIGTLATAFGHEFAFGIGSLLAVAATALVAVALTESAPVERTRWTLGD